MKGLDQSVNYCNLNTIKDECFIVGKQNGLFLADMQTLRVTSILQSNIGIQENATG